MGIIMTIKENKFLIINSLLGIAIILVIGVVRIKSDGIYSIGSEPMIAFIIGIFGYILDSGKRNKRRVK